MIKTIMIEFFKNNYFLVIMLVVATVLCYLWLFIFNREKLKASWWELIIVTLCHTIVGVLTVKLFAFMESGETNGAMSLYGGIFFMPLTYIIYAKIKGLRVLKTCDILVICLPLTYVCARVNCLYSGCCLGKFLPGSTELRYPTRELEIAFHALFAIIGGLFIVKNKNHERVFFAYLGCYGLFRFIVEFFRESNSESVFHIAHIWSIISIVLSIALLVIAEYIKREKAKEVSKKHNRK